MSNNIPLSDLLSGEGTTAFERIIESTSVSIEAQNAWTSIEDYIKSQYLSNDEEIEIVISIQNDGKVFINYGCKSNEETPTNMSIADALDIIKLATINGLKTAVHFPLIPLREQSVDDSLICSIGILC